MLRFPVMRNGREIIGSKTCLLHKRLEFYSSAVAFNLFYAPFEKGALNELLNVGGRYVSAFKSSLVP